MTLPTADSILVTGATGQLGHAFRELLPEAVHLAKADFDLTDLDLIGPSLAAHDPQAIINCAAYTAVDRAEDEEDLARAVNADAVGEMARFASTREIPFVTFSTDYVFDGVASRPYVESDTARPVNAYGRSKRAGELLALAAYPRTLIVRTSWLVSGSHPCFVTSILRAAASRTITVVDDQVGRPTIALDLATTTLRALDRGVTGILHLTNSGDSTTWFDLAREVLRLSDMDPARVRPCATSDYPTRAKRPAYSILDSERWDETRLTPLPDWKTSLRDVVWQFKPEEPSLDS